MSQARGVTVPGPDGFADPAEVQGKEVAAPQTSEGQQGFELGIQGWLGLLGLPLDQQII